MNVCDGCSVEFADDESCSDELCNECAAFRAWFFGDPFGVDVKVEEET